MTVWMIGLCGASLLACSDSPGGGMALDAAMPDAAEPAPVHFKAQVSYSTGAAGPSELAVRDINGDGFADLVAVNNGTSSLATLLNAGDTTFSAAVLHPTTMYPISIELEDINGDGHVDLISSNGIHLNLGDGTFGSEITHDAGGVEARLADFNADGKLDLVLSNPGIFSVQVLLGNGDGTFAQSVSYPVASSYTSKLVVEDVNNDGKQDIVVTVTGNSSDPRRAVSVALGTGTGSFATFRESDIGISDAVGLALGDLDGDGNLDVVAASAMSKEFATARGRGDGTFDAPVTYALRDRWNLSVAIADLNADAKPDVTLTDGLNKSVGVALNRGDGTLAPVISFAVDTEPVFVTTTDLDKDGRTDLVVLNRQLWHVTGMRGTISVLLNDGNGAQ